MSWHPHNDDEDPTANDCNYNFLRFSSLLCLDSLHVCLSGRRDTRLQGLSDERKTLEMA